MLVGSSGSPSQLDLSIPSGIKKERNLSLAPDGRIICLPWTD